jgi:hypothetical protein
MGTKRLPGSQYTILVPPDLLHINSLVRELQVYGLYVKSILIINKTYIKFRANALVR